MVAIPPPVMRGTILNKVTFRSSFELLTPLDATLLRMWVLPSRVGDSVSSLRNGETQIADIKKRYHDSISWGRNVITNQEMLS